MRLEVVDRISSIEAAAWDALAVVDNPFVEHAFLSLLEESGSVGRGTGWLPRFVLVRDARGLLGAAPAWLRGDSYGEYIFDWRWAEAAARVGLRYYPKITVAVPFTPATGPRLLVRPGVERGPVVDLLARGLEELRASEGASSIHVLYCEDREAVELVDRGFLRRASLQFHFRNGGWRSFDDLLSSFRHDERKNIRRERRRVQEAGVEVRIARGDELSAEAWSRLHALYASTIDRKWGRPYLTERFFRLVPERLGDRAVVVLAERAGRRVAMSLSFEKGRALYGRHYGAPEEIPGVHFELCYYRLLERALERGMVLVEAGAQGEHKLKRGFLPVLTHSAHRIAHEELEAAVREACARERDFLLEERDELARHGPFREGQAPPFPLVAGIDLEPDRLTRR